MLRLDDVAGLVEFETFAPAPRLDLGPPFVERRLVRREFARLHLGDKRFEDPRGIADDRKVDLHILVHRDDGSISQWILVEFGENPLNRSGDTVVETCAEIQHHVAAVHGKVGLVGAVHAKHAEETWIDADSAPSPIRVSVVGQPVISTSSVSSSDARGPELIKPPPP